MSDPQSIGMHAKSWPFVEAKRLVERLNKKKPEKGYVLFETGYGPSGLPHIGTFGEVLRTSMVRHAFSLISDYPTKLFCFSDDMDGFRKVPTNVPNQDLLTKDLNKPLTKVADPFGEYESFGHYNNAMLRRFLDSFGFDYEFKSSTECYKSGIFDETLLKILSNYEEVMAIMLPSLRAERRATYSPFLPISQITGEVLQVPIIECRKDAGTIVYKEPATEKLTEVSVTGGYCKLQWKVDWAMRWCALDVDYEMSGKDLIDSVKLSNKITRVLGNTPPENLTYELFLDADGQKISKSKGNGLSIDEWLKYAPQESLSYYMFQAPKRAKRLYFDVIPKAVDEYSAHLTKFEKQEDADKLDNPLWHVHLNSEAPLAPPVTFGMLLNLASVCHAEDAEILWGFVKKYAPDATAETRPFLAKMIDCAINYYKDFIAPNKNYRKPTDKEKAAIIDLSKQIKDCSEPTTENLQTIVFEVGKSHGFTELRQWFLALYQILLGQEQGPRMGSFIELYGVENTCKLISRIVNVV